MLSAKQENIDAGNAMTASAIPAAKARAAPYTAPVHRQLAALCYRKGVAADIGAATGASLSG
jgi:hypothetical protein